VPQSYEPKFFYMEVVLLVYKLVMSAVVVLFLPGTVAQLVFAVIVTLAVAVMMLKLQPYVNDR
jgi:hypothetical protein